MKLWLLSLICAMIFLMASSVIAGTEGNNLSMKVYFYEFKMVTYGDITKDNVEVLPNYEIHFYGKHHFIRKLTSILTKRTTKKNIDNKNIRLKVKITANNKDKEKIFFVDNKGIAVDDKLLAFQLSLKEMDQIQQDIIGYHGVVDKNPNTSP